MEAGVSDENNGSVRIATLFGKKIRLVLASQSPRRLELLRRIGLEPEVIVSGVSEKTEETEPDRVVMDLSRQKAEHVAGMLMVEDSGAHLLAEDHTAAQPPYLTVVIGADTVVCVDGRIMGKPQSHQEAEQMIRRIAGRTHQVYSGVTILNVTDRKRVTYAGKTDVTVSAMTDEEIRDYAYSSEPMDKAGAYGIQGLFGRYIDSISGDYTGVVGLPVGSLYQKLKEVIGL